MSADKTQPITINDHVRTLLDEGAIATLVTILKSHSLKTGAKLLIKEDGEAFGDLSDDRLNHAVTQHAGKFLRARDEAKSLGVVEFAPELESLSDTVILFERIETEPRLVVAGAGHVGAALARLAALAGYSVTLIDDRSEFVSRHLFSSAPEQGIALVTAADWSEAMREALGNGRGVSVAIVTRGHKQDEDCLRATIAAHPDYIGMIGSRRRTNIVLDKLREEGFDSEELIKVRAPIGLDIGAVSPEEVALSILAEIIAERRGGSGSPLSKWRRD